MDVYLDFDKAFDTVPHSILLEKLTAHGLDRDTLPWLKTGWMAESESEWNYVQLEAGQKWCSPWLSVGTSPAKQAV